MSPLVSINLCCYNGEKHLEQTLQSIFSQTYKHWQLVIVNDGSTDSTEVIIKKHMAEGWPIVYHYQENAGLGAARNKALELSSGSIIAFIDQDDLWLPKKLEKQIPLFNDPEVGLVFCDTLFFDQMGNCRRLYDRNHYWTGWCFSKLLSHYFLSLETVAIRRSALDTLQSFFDPRFNMIEEADLFRRIAHKWKLAMVDEPLAKWRVHSENWTWKIGHTVAEETQEMLDNYSRIIPQFKRKYALEITILRQSVVKDSAFFFWKQGKGKECRAKLRPFLLSSYKILFLFMLSYLPERYGSKIIEVFRHQSLTSP